MGCSITCPGDKAKQVAVASAAAAQHRIVKVPFCFFVSGSLFPINIDDKRLSLSSPSILCPCAEISCPSFFMGCAWSWREKPGGYSLHCHIFFVFVENKELHKIIFAQYSPSALQDQEHQGGEGLHQMNPVLVIQTALRKP